MQLSPAETTRDPDPPLPQMFKDIERWKHTRLRRRLLYGQWDDDLRELVVAAAGTRRADAWKMVDLSVNLFRSSMSQVAVQYDRRPFVLHADQAGRELATLVGQGQLWGLMPRFQRDVLGLRECFVRADVVRDPDTAELRPTYRSVSPDYITGLSHPDAPGRPMQLCEAILRDLPGGGQMWTWEKWDVAPGHEPSVQVVDEKGADCSRQFLKRADGSAAPSGGLRGSDFTWRGEAGTPFLPYALYHATHTAQLWDATEARELVAGALNCALYWSFWGHLIRNAAWMQRYAVGAKPKGAGVTGGDQSQRTGVQADAATIMLFEIEEEFAGTPVLGAFPQPADPMVVAEAIALYERRVAAFAGISPSDVMRVAGDPRSGFALAITREGQREAQVRFEPQFRLGDERVFWITAQLMRRANGRRYPGTGFEVEYQTIPSSLEELKADREDVLAKLEAGLIDKVTAYRRFNKGVSEVEAAVELVRIQQVNAELGGSGDATLAGAQTQALQGVVSAVVRGELPAAGAAAILKRSYGLSDQEAGAMLAGAEDLAKLAREARTAAPPTTPVPAAPAA